MRELKEKEIYEERNKERLKKEKKGGRELIRERDEGKNYPTLPHNLPHFNFFSLPPHLSCSPK